MDILVCTYSMRRCLVVKLYVQSNQKMHDLYATKHISQIALPDAFRAVWSQIFS